MSQPLFHIGQEVVLVRDDFTLLLVQNPNIEVPKAGPIYHVRANCIFSHAVGLLLDEIHNEGVAPGFPEANFDQTRFAAPPEVDSLALAEALEESTLAPA